MIFDDIEALGRAGQRVEWAETFGDKLTLVAVESLNATGGYEHDGPRVPVDQIEHANVASSASPGTDTLHRPVLDIDMPCWLFESSTPGHHHLVIDKAMPWEDYLKLLHVLAEVGIIEGGFMLASERRGYSSMRLPWVRKNGEQHG